MIRKLTVSSLIWEASSEIHESQADALRNLGYRHHFFHHDEPIPTGTDIVLVTGPYGTMLPFIHQLRDLDPTHRPILAYWFEESLEMRGPGRLRAHIAKVFSEIHRDGSANDPMTKLAGSLLPRPLRNKGKRLGFLGDILWLHRHDMLDVFALCSTVYAQYFNSLGIPSILIPRGFHPSYGRHLGTERDIAAVWLGKERTRRRANAIAWLQEALDTRGLCMLIFDGVRNDFIFGEERTQLLNRALFVVNFNFSGPTDELSLRYYVAAANGCVVITEPNLNEYPFKPGIHLVECELKEMPDRIQFFIDHPADWRRISDTMLSKMRSDLTMEKSIQPILLAAEKAHRRRGSLV